MFLRRMGVDTLVFSPAVVQALTELDVLDGKLPSAKKTWSKLQVNLDSWYQETNYSLNEMSQLLALSVNETVESNL